MLWITIKIDAHSSEQKKNSGRRNKEKKGNTSSFKMLPAENAVEYRIFKKSFILTVL